jgi:tRNA pseudouridine38-40 synthase
LRYFLEIAYKGTNYHGWQVQKNAHSVQQELNQCLQRLFQKDIETVGSGRTDTGVHAEQQFVHLDLDKELTENHIFKLNCLLPWDIAINSFVKVKPDASARFDAISRSYEYRISRIKDPFMREQTCYFGKDLNIEKMQRAAQILYKYQDYQSFSKVHTSVDHFLCTILNAEWVEKKNLLTFKIEANRFLRGMVRTIVGTLMEVGMERMTVKEFEEIIQKKDRKVAGRSVPAEGLFLTKIKYPKSIFIK